VQDYTKKVAQKNMQSAVRLPAPRRSSDGIILIRGATTPFMKRRWAPHTNGCGTPLCSVR
jgi:hypothetical protein